VQPLESSTVFNVWPVELSGPDLIKSYECPKHSPLPSLGG
jgi:hypothetical protein